MKRYNITTVKTYDKDGQEKKMYPQVGKLVHFEAGNGKEESFILELNMFPNTRFCVFKDEPRDNNQGAKKSYSNNPANTAPASGEAIEPDPDIIDYPEDGEPNLEDIPF